MRVALFVTCLGDHFFADAGVAAVRLLRHLGVEVSFPADQTCCGQPAFNAGYVGEARAMARHTLRILDDALDEADAVVVPSGSCTAMLRSFYGELLGGGDARPDSAVGPGGGPGGRARGGGRVRERTYELSELLVDELGVDSLGDGLRGRRVAYHHGCHALRELGVREAPLRLLRGSGAEVVAWEADEECCGFGGLFSVKNPEVSAAMADRKLDTLPAAGEVDVLTSADGGCLLQLRGRMERRRSEPAAGEAPARAEGGVGGRTLPVRHLAELLWEAVEGEGRHGRP